MPKARLTYSFIRRALCPSGLKKIDFFDAEQRGFLLEVRASGGKTFYQRYRDSRGRERQFKIGAADVLRVSQARRKARHIAAAALLGDDPQKRRQELRTIPTFAAFIQQRYLPFAKDSKRSWQTDETVLRIHILPVLGRLALDEVLNQSIAKLLGRMRDKGYASGTTNRVLAILRFIFNLAKKWDIPGAGNNPTAGLSAQPDVCRERFLTEEEARRLIAALENDENQVAAKAIKLLLLTGARRNEITYAQWGHVDWSKRSLLIPVSKSGKPRAIALNCAALDLLRAIAPLDGNPYIFPSPVTGRPSPSLHFPWLRIRRASGLLDVRLHDLRHSFASFLVNKGISLYVVQNLLGHSQPRMTQRYAHLAMQTLADAADVVGNMFEPGDARAPADRSISGLSSLPVGASPATVHGC